MDLDKQVKQKLKNAFEPTSDELWKMIKNPRLKHLLNVPSNELTKEMNLEIKDLLVKEKSEDVRVRYGYILVLTCAEEIFGSEKEAIKWLKEECFQKRS